MVKIKLNLALGKPIASKPFFDLAHGFKSLVSSLAPGQ